MLYIFWFLHQTTTVTTNKSPETWLYIFWFLHQTTTMVLTLLTLFCCISFDSYIKPQLLGCSSFLRHVVYLLIPTSNHNCSGALHFFVMLYIFWFLHQTTTRTTTALCGYVLYIFWFLHQTTTILVLRLFVLWLYIFWFLHQTTTPPPDSLRTFGCISFDSYIKPQQYLICATTSPGCISFDSYIKPQQNTARQYETSVVYLLIPTSNHNYLSLNMIFFMLYIFWFLHQTTTVAVIRRAFL